MTTVSEHLELPGGAVAEGAHVRVYLAGAGGNPVGEAYAAGETIIAEHETEADASGEWSLDLVPNEDITPAGTVWARVVSPPAPSRRSQQASTVYMDVPAVGGPFTVDEVLAEPPASIATFHATVLVHGDDANVARPVAELVIWKGSVEPANMAAGDLWSQVP